MTEPYACAQIARRLERLRRTAPDAETVRRGYMIATNKYRDHVLNGHGTPENGAIIKKCWITKQAFALYAAECGISLEVIK